MKAILLVGLGGFLGAVLRYGTSLAVRGRLGEEVPFATLTVNVLGCLAIGLALGTAGRAPDLPEAWRLALVVGLLGSFTTFSTLGQETVELLARGRPELALGSVAANLLIGLPAVWLGARLVA